MRQEKNHRPDGAAGEEEILRVCLALFERDDADEGDDREIDENDDDRDHRWVSSFDLSGLESCGSDCSRCSGQANLTSTAIMIAARME